MKITRGYKTELDLNKAQITACLKHAGAARFAYNWGLCRYREEYAAGNRTPNAINLHKELNALKQTDFPWMYDVSKCAPQEALRDLSSSSSANANSRKWGSGKASLATQSSRPRREDRVFICEACGLVLDRDLNAAQNLAATA